MTNFFNKSGVISINLFSLMILLFIGVLVLTSTFYLNFKNSYQDVIDEKDILLYLSEIRSKLIIGASYNDSQIELSPAIIEDIEVFAQDSILQGRIYKNDRILEYNVSMLGLNFCSSYSFYSGSNLLFGFNGDCFSLIT